MVSDLQFYYLQNSKFDKQTHSIDEYYICVDIKLSIYSLLMY